MTTQLNFSASANPVSALVGAGLTDAKAAPAGADSGTGSRFAELFSGQMLKLERQGLAAAQDGLGYLILTSTAQSQTPLAFAAIALLTVLSIALFHGIEFIEKRVIDWTP